MKAAFFALCALCLITALCIFSSSKIDGICKDTEAYVNALPTSTDGISVKHCEDAVEKWEKDSLFLSYFISSREICDVEEALITVKNSVETASDDEFAAAKASLTANLELMRTSQCISLENIF